MTAKITVKRDSGYADRMRDYRVLLDGKEIGRIANDERKTFDVASGAHTLSLGIDWCRSNTLSFNIADRAEAAFDCGSNLRGTQLLLAAYYALFARSKYLWLKAAG